MERKQAVPHLAGMTRGALELWAAQNGAKPGAARMFARHLAGRLAGRTTDGQPSQALLQKARFAEDLPRHEAIEDSDGTTRFAIHLDDGEIVEAVLIRQAGRDTVCVSSQVGCARGCVFCETGRMGLVRNLSAAEIVCQYAIAVKSAKQKPCNVVFMGMGEPLDNLDEVVKSIEVLTDPLGFAVPERKITVSTVGILNKLPELFERTSAQVALSLHAVDKEQRLALLPIARKHSLEQIREALEKAPRSVLLQWTLIEGVNDAEKDADALAEFARGLNVRVNVIPLNPGPVKTQQAPSIEKCRAFQKRLADRGVRTLLRLPHGREALGACGQLAGALRELR
jgi:23S rRNA (adenine2503-C2)-methyltransferase